MSGWVRYLQLKARAKIGFSSGVLILGIVAVLCSAATLGFLVFAAFIWLAERYSPLTAALVLCGFFLLVTIIAGIGCLVSHRNTIARAERELAARNNSPWFDPKMMGIGLQIGHAIGWRKLVPLAAVGVIAAGLAREWFAHDRPRQDDNAESDAPAES